MDQNNIDRITAQRQALLDFCDEYKIFDDFGSLCMICCGTPYIAKLVGIGHDRGDYYYILLEFDRGLKYHTCVDRCQSLKGKIDEYDYHLRRYDESIPMNMHLLEEDACIDLEEFKLRGLHGNTGVYYSRDEIVNGYIDVNKNI